MSAETTVTLLHPGSMGTAVGEQLRTGGAEVRWVTAGRSEATRSRAVAAGLTAVPTLAEALAGSSLVLSICPPAFAEDVAKEVAALGFGGLFADANAIAPDRAGRIAGLMPGRVVDGGIIGGPPRRAGTTRLYLSGPGADVVAALFAGTALEAVLLDGPVGKASGLKMAYASYQKISRVLGAVSHALAREYGVEEHLDREAELLDSRPLADVAAFPGVAARAWRWGPEMEEAARALREARLPGDIAEGAALALSRWDADKDRTDSTPAEVLDHLLR